jgi:hypothetical protein
MTANSHSVGWISISKLWSWQKDTKFFWEEKAQRRIKTLAVSSKVPRDASVIYWFSSVPHYWWLETCRNDFCKPRSQIKMLNSHGDKCSTGTLAWNAGLQLPPRLEDKVPCTIFSVAESPDVFVVACKIIRCDSVSFTHNMSFDFNMIHDRTNQSHMTPSSSSGFIP